MMALKQTFANSMLNSIPTDFETNVGRWYANRLRWLYSETLPTLC